MSSQPVDRLHPVVDFAHRLCERLDSVAKVPLWSMNEGAAARRADHPGARRGTARRAPGWGLLAEADRSGATTDTGAGTAADWIAIETRQVRRDARSDLRLAQALDRYDVLSAAMAEGKVDTAQARAIVAALDRLPTTGEFAVSTDQRTEAETHLVALGRAPRRQGTTNPRRTDLRSDRTRPRREVQRPGARGRRSPGALRRTTLTMWEDDEGTCHGRFRIPALHGQMLTKMILAISSPSRSTNDNVSSLGSGIDPDLPTPVRHGIALAQLIETYLREKTCRRPAAAQRPSWSR